MERPELTAVVDKLTERGYRAARAWPGTRMPHIQKPAVAVALAGETAERLLLSVVVFCPEHLGGKVCEEEARNVANALREMGLSCNQGACRYDGKSDRFSVEIQAGWDAESKKLPYSVSIDGNLMRWTTAFTMERKKIVASETEPESASEEQLWTLTLEEMIPSDTPETETGEPFTLLLRRGSWGERYDNCIWTTVRRQDTREGLSQIRIGVSSERKLMMYEGIES